MGGSKERQEVTENHSLYLLKVCNQKVYAQYKKCTSLQSMWMFTFTFCLDLSSHLGEGSELHG